MSKYNKNVAIITGATSFLGRCVASFLLSKGFIVFGIVRPNSDKINILKKISGLNIIKLDFESFSSSDFKNIIEENDDNKKTFEVIKNIHDFNCDITFIHFAWGATLDRMNFAKQMLNIDMSAKALAFAKIIGANRFIFAGSQAEMSESAYGMAKKQFASIANEDLQNSTMKFIHLRIFSIYGKDDRETSLLKQLVKSFKDNKDIELSSCEYQWNFLHIDDFTNIIYNFILKNIDSGIFDIASEDTRLLKDYIIEAHKVYNAKNKLLFGKRPDSLEKFAIPNISNMINAIGSYSFIKFSDGIMRI